MFGYVTLNITEATEEQRQRYRSFYCGLCAALHRRYGQIARFTLTYDMAFLALLHTALYETETTESLERCAPHPIKPHCMLYNRHLDYAADMTVILSYYNLMDNWQDEHSLPSRAMAEALKKSFADAGAKYPRQNSAIRFCLDGLAEYEAQNEQDPDKVSSCFGRLLGEIMAEKNDHWSDELRRLGFSLGKFVYLMDAYEDLPKDMKKGSYNPLNAMKAQPDYEEKIGSDLELCMAECAAAFERLPILQDADILRNILYSGVWSRYNELQARRHKQKG